jgi:hypothetical protein
MPKAEPIYTVQRSFKMKPITFEEILEVSHDRNIKYGTLLRIIVEEWLEENRK